MVFPFLQGRVVLYYPGRMAEAAGEGKEEAAHDPCLLPSERAAVRTFLVGCFATTHGKHPLNVLYVEELLRQIAAFLSLTALNAKQRAAAEGKARLAVGDAESFVVSSEGQLQRFEHDGVLTGGVDGVVPIPSPFGAAALGGERVRSVCAGGLHCLLQSCPSRSIYPLIE